ncbi:MAG: RNB domain-containing ribonuclease, partial [Anaerolineaceae bacterium]|nr:RNB domain-containing ribonuclease [Anaerolineaceae bacterium]
EIIGGVRQAELLSERHWTMVYLLQHPAWQGEGILVEKRGSSGTLILPDLALETRVHLKQNWPLDQSLPVMLTGVNLAQREASFRVVE